MPTKQAAKNNGAKRKREHDDRKRAQGLKDFRAWVTPDERKLLVDTLTRHRLNVLKNALANFRNKRGE